MKKSKENGKKNKENKKKQGKARVKVFTRETTGAIWRSYSRTEQF